MARAMAPLASAYVSAFVVGFCGVIAQVVVLREMVVTFHGNELSIGVMLASWLAWSGVGSLGVGRLARRLRRPGLALAVALAAMGLLLLATVVGARYLKVFLRASEGASLGQIRPFGTMLASALALLGPFCLVNGLLFPLACRAAEAAGGAVGGVYLLEAAGAAVGGACYTFALVHWLDPLALASALAAVCCCVAAGARGLEAPRTWRGGSLVGLAAGSLGAAAVLLAAGGLPGPLLSMDAAYWRPLLVFRSSDSRYGRVTVTGPGRSSEQRTLYVNGLLAFSYPDPPAAEAVAHLPMLEHPMPPHVLLLGGGPGVVEEVLKHPSVEKLTYLELDPLVVEMVRSELPPAAAKALRDKRVEVVLADGRAFLKGTSQRYDVIISAAGPPATAQANRFYTVEFFREAARALQPGGVFAFHISGWHDYIPDETRRLLACLHRSLAAAFPHIVVFPGAPCTFLASDREGVVGYRLGVLDARLAERGVATAHVDVRLWEAQLVGGRLEELQRVVSAPAEPNRDLSPRCYYYEAQRWSALQRLRRAGAGPPWHDLGRVLEFLDRHPAFAPLVLLGVVGALSLAAPLARRRWRDGAVAFAIASTGLIEMGVEFAVLLGFQVACGYVYQYVGLLVASFMLGLASGAWVSSRWVASGRATWRRMEGVQVCICGYPLLLLGFLWVATGTGLGAAPGVAGVLFSLVALSAGLVGGLQFPLAAALHSAGGASAGALYGLDLFGACLGALAVSSVLVPTFGLDGVSVMLAVLGALGLIGLLAAGWTRPAPR